MDRSRIIAIFLVSFCLDQAHAQTLALPPRPDDAYTRDDMLRILTPLTREAREDSVYRWFMAGNVPAFLRTLVPVTASAVISGHPRSVTFHTTPDYLALGPDDRYLLMPMTPLLAQRLADALRCTLPTRKMVNEIYAASSVKLAPAPIPPSGAMITVPVFVQHDSIVWTQRQPVLGSFPHGSLVGGTKKDVVISNKIRSDLKPGVPKPVVIYGWHQLNGSPIQPLYNGHGETYADYSHGIRLVLNAAELDGAPTTVSAVLTDDALSVLLSDEGVIARPRYGDAPAGIGISADTAGLGSMFEGAFPNPFNTSTEVRYRLASDDAVTLKVYDLLGRETATLVDAAMDAGAHEVTFDGSGHASGVYIVRFMAGRSVQSGKIVLLR